MRVNYLGPCLVVDHPAVEAMERCRRPSCYLVEVSDEAGVEGPIIEGDVLVVDEAQPVQHADLVVVEVESQLRLYRSHRIGGAFRLVPACGGQGMTAKPAECRGVVVHRARLAA
ncbi:S24 family peptidase [Billgrantia gudaonensis]|uniref:Peptidase S24/S26A/S26B/S26C domain-containing protein n=1 Tax=Billgrantia gudaonensis TaxID=376427 RepID=A0A1G8XE31_9GAMM|nr:S24 family peptidase [Halomonas gudaonensis]SDJ88676.1 hypothetical protein SAMN04487954_10911 [Halomonas gudaonensis]